MRAICEEVQWPNGIGVSPDGLTVYVSDYARKRVLARFDPDGRPGEIVELLASFVSSISCGGSDRRDVLISTAGNDFEPKLGGTLLLARSEIPGVAVTPVVI